jgi:predicted peroxiredoxin
LRTTHRLAGGHSFGRTEENKGGGRVVVNLAAGPEESEKVTAAFLVATSALEKNRPTVMFLTGPAVRFALEEHPEPIQTPGAPRLSRLVERFALDGGNFYVCAMSFKARGLNKNALMTNARLVVPADLWTWIDEGGAIAFSY